MLVLVIDTATPYVTAGLVDVTSRDTIRARSNRSVRDSRAHNEVLTPFIMECCDEVGVTSRDLDAVVVGVGPGPFTGLRVGMATAAAFGDALDIPVIGVCSLDGLAWNAVADATQHEGDTIIVATDARRREVYWATYRMSDGHPVRVTEPEVTRPTDVHVPGKADTPAQQPSFAVVSDSVADALLSSVTSVNQSVDAQPDIVNFVRAALDHPMNLDRANLDRTKNVDDSADSTRDDSDRNALFPRQSDLQSLRPLYLRRPDAVPPKAKPVSPAISEEAITRARQLREQMTADRDE
ncbi:tRNA (adenosine(37)-N6)-threonylcarbamoyltransferase complex dimerization subunit type 1 TsaB [Corynebacterium kroppenstedtii]|uniref:Putative O-sialoglycoprotein endopeptidase n=1 Tax=Corynebacterium kroppenstedtii (strain DSM 44385 / JCM 11950 / CIP 105744 / CCUG 35717) TaxID=645127 RepID=C4LKV6_CORK4|nr:tRNA (adenosine(37)-N6)-threonylcarbamoyltransferase complex dimerization subunit type 1 TsaB [Corynebacterium kroppenstedtii]ACR18461.1 putative O-sialoglycoprotein endopeptidase [Corynebacterium kroppenstedtii DSM 44385]QRP10207.1 tRNA (adenosine(37)-N6)-threonylcarbamoyltransferase complex dimerization subunit type 1 TsaB [Corynebacterium kroppenstedtii]